MPLSISQEGLWLAHQLDPASPAYNVVLAVRIRDRIRTGALQEALTAVTDRHELLRSRFVAGADGPERVRGPAGSVRLDVREVPSAGDEELFRLARRAAGEPFDLAGDGAFRAVLLRRAPDDSVLVTATHHLVSDATSQWLIVRDLLTAYGQLARGRRPDLGPPPAPWDDRVSAEQRLLASPRGERARAHWQSVVDGVPAAELSTDRPRPARRTLNGATHELVLPPETGRALIAAAAASATTPFAWLLATFQAALHRSGCGLRFLIGCPVSTRLSPGTRQAVGYYVNALPITASFTPTTTLADLVASAKRQLTQGLAHAGHPTELLGRKQLFHISMTLVAADRLPAGELFDGPATVGGVRVELCDVPQQEGQQDLTVEVLQGAAGFRSLMRFNTDLYERDSIERLADIHLRMIGAALTDPRTPVGRVPLVDEDDLASLLALGSGTP
ncbi:condensation domain-containing protein [Streptomyces sp. NPDC004609]|uniref:condensation domain-containing protein n=1 Tax=Streptomyces sp. NPDC004609 TaxID=3364704 RepID=UPI0036C830C0